MSSALALAAFDGRLLADIAVHDDATRSVLVVNNLSGVRSEVASITADIAHQISDAASSSFAHLVSRLAAHEKSERLVEVIDQTVLPRVHVDGLNSRALQLLERDVAASLVRNIDNTSLRHAAFMLALRSGLCSGDLKVVPGYESVTVDIERNYSSSMFLFGVQDTSGNEAVDLKVEGPDYDYENPRVWLETRKIHGCAGKRELGLAWLLKSYGGRLLAAFTADTHECAEAMPYAQMRSRTWDVIDARMFLLMKSMLEHQASVAVVVGIQASALSTVASAMQQVASVAVPAPPSVL
jgi:hypothetical protein